MGQEFNPERAGAPPHQLDVQDSATPGCPPARSHEPGGSFVVLSSPPDVRPDASTPERPELGPRGTTGDAMTVTNHAEHHRRTFITRKAGQATAERSGRWRAIDAALQVAEFGFENAFSIRALRAASAMLRSGCLPST